MGLKFPLNHRKPLIKHLSPLILIIGSLGAQEIPLSEIFFLDLGIVIEPNKGSEVSSHFVEKPSDEVSFKIKKVESGSVYMASSKELLSTLGRINNRIERLENSFHTEVNILRQENGQLKQSLAEMQNRNNLSNRREHTPILSPKTELVKKTKTKPIQEFNQSTYMAGVFAYQREDYQTALSKFLSLNLQEAPKKTVENILYWTADAYQQTGQYENALQLLNKISITGTLRIDDALVQKGLLHRKMGNESLAIIAFSNVVSQHPDSEYFRLAKMELKTTDGHQ